jgi:hypothetical protein
MLTWIATIRIPSGNDVQIQVRAPTQYVARQLIELQYRGAILLHAPYKLD